jgi:hypothetical protein
MENDLVLRGNAVGLISGNGGGVYIGVGSTFTMTGGTITGVTVTASDYGYGGAVYAASGSTFIMKGGIITGNNAVRGAGVCIANAAFTMSGGSIEDNGEAATTIMAGGLYIITSTGAAVQPVITMSGGTITGNKANDGAGVSVENSVFIMDGGTITGNQAVVDGGGIRLMWSAQAIINDGVIGGNTSGASGGGIYVGRETSGVTMSGGTILGNTAGQAGGGVYVTTVWGGAPSFTMTGGTLAENQAGTYGGGVYVMDGGVFTKGPLTENASSGVIYGYSADNPSSNRVQGGLGIETARGAAVYLSAAKKRETTVLPDQTLDSAVAGEEGGWLE